MDNNGKISIQQMALLVILSVIGDSILILPSITAIAAKQDGWICGLLGILLGLLVMLFLYYVSSLHPELTVVQYSRLLLGRWVGAFVSLFILGHYLLTTSALIREIGDFMMTQLLSVTPLWSLNLLLIVILLWGVLSGLETIGRASEIIFPWFTLSLVLLIVFLMPKFDFDNIQPIFAEGFKPIMSGTLHVVMYPFGELSFFLMILPSVKRGPHMRKDFIMAAMIGGVALTALVFITILVLGYYLTSHLMYPTYALAKKISIGHFLERVEVILAVIWMLSGFFKTVLFTYAFSLGTTQLLDLRDQHVVTWPMLFLLFGCSYEISPNIAYYNEALLKYWPFLDMTVAIIIPAILVLVHKLRGFGNNKLMPT